jgi:hypothetical protein
MKPMMSCLAITFAAWLTGCATPGYWADRGRDSLDVFTIQVGYGLGAKARVGPLQSGLLMDIGGPGVRGGDLMGIEDVDSDGKPAKQDYVGIVVGMESFYGTGMTRRRGKSFSSGQLAVIAWPWRREESGWQFAKEPASFFTQIEAVGAAGPSFRLGFNPGELLDFILGWFPVDIYKDDLGAANESDNLEP